MDDLISRRAAIEAFLTETSDGDKAEWCIWVISQLPSVQSETIACADCKHWICHDRRCAVWNHGVKPLDWCSYAERRER